jgi:hypothetical protein
MSPKTYFQFFYIILDVQIKFLSQVNSYILIVCMILATLGHLRRSQGWKDKVTDNPNINTDFRNQPIVSVSLLLQT